MTVNKSPKKFINMTRLRKSGCGCCAQVDLQETYSPRYRLGNMLSHRRATKRLDKLL